jgi:hypothetical protein
MVWQDVNTSDSSYGLVGIWLLSGGALSTATFPASITPSQYQLTVGNVLSDNPPDLIWHNLATGQVTEWTLVWNAQSSSFVLTTDVLGTA